MVAMNSGLIPMPVSATDIDQLYTARHSALFLAHIYADASARFRVFDGVGEDVDINLIQAELIRIQVFLLHLIDMETEIEFFSLSIGCEIFTRFSTVSTIENVKGLNFSFPLSTLDISKMSLISVSR